MSTEGEPYAAPTEGPRIARLLRGSRVSLGAELAAAYFDARGKAASRSALADALATIEGLAARCEPVELHLRTAQTDGGVVWLDLGHEKGNCVRIDADGWKLTDEPEVLFRRSPVTAPMPEPSPDGDLLALRDLLALPEDSGAWPLIVGWLVGTMFPGMPRPVLLLTGEQGSGKSFITRKVAGVLDPAIPPTRCAPRDERDWIAATSASAVVALDNISTVQDWLSDAICRAVTGEGFVRRRLYTDNDVAVTTFRRSIIANGIDLGAYRGDLLDRSIIVELPRIEADRRRTEEDLDREYKRLLPKILAGLLDLTVKVLGELPTVQVHQPPRMADYARILAALDQATGSRTLDAYRSVGREALSSAVDADHVARAVAAMLDTEGAWTGTATDLLHELDSRQGDGRPPKGWPTTPQHLAGRLRCVAPALRADGYVIDAKKTHGGSRIWTLSKSCGAEVEMVGKSPSAPSRRVVCGDGEDDERGDQNPCRDGRDGEIPPSLFAETRETVGDGGETVGDDETPYRDARDGRDGEIPTTSTEWGEV